MQIPRHYSRQRLPYLVQWQGLKRPISHSQFKQTSYTHNIHQSKYNPLADTHLHVYLGKKKLKNKLQNMGYVFNPEQTKIIRKQVNRRKPLSKLDTKRQNPQARTICKTIVTQKSLSKQDLLTYINSMKHKINKK